MKLLRDTKTNMNRKNITDTTNAIYRANKLYTELIFNKYDPNITVESVTNSNCDDYKHIFETNTVIFSKFDNDLENVRSNGINFFKSIVRALLWELDFNEITYTGEYCEYYDCGQIKNKM